MTHWRIVRYRQNGRGKDLNDLHPNSRLFHYVASDGFSSQEGAEDHVRRITKGCHLVGKYYRYEVQECPDH